MKLHDGETLTIEPFGKRLRRSAQYVAIDLSPEEIVDWWLHHTDEQLYKYLATLTTYYKTND
jgi:hypothetical protein